MIQTAQIAAKPATARLPVTQTIVERMAETLRENETVTAETLEQFGFTEAEILIHSRNAVALANKRFTRVIEHA